MIFLSRKLWIIINQVKMKYNVQIEFNLIKKSEKKLCNNSPMVDYLNIQRDRQSDVKDLRSGIYIHEK